MTGALIPSNQLANFGVTYTERHRRRLEAAGRFPLRVRLSAKRHAYVRDEIVAYCNALIAQRDGTEAAA